MGGPIRIWRFADAPPEYQELSQHGGDEDWVLHCPAVEAGWHDLPFAMSQVIEGDEDDYLHGFGHVDRHKLANGDLVAIFAHA